MDIRAAEHDRTMMIFWHIHGGVIGRVGLAMIDRKRKPMDNLIE